MDDIGLRSMTFRTSKEAPSGNQVLERAYTWIFGGMSVNRVDPIDIALSYSCRKNGQNFLLMTQVWGCILPSLVLGLRAQLPGIGLPAIVYRVTLVPQYLRIYSIRGSLSVGICILSSSFRIRLTAAAFLRRGGVALSVVFCLE